MVCFPDALLNKHFPLAGKKLKVKELAVDSIGQSLEGKKTRVLDLMPSQRPLLRGISLADTPTIISCAKEALLSYHPVAKAVIVALDKEITVHSASRGVSTFACKQAVSCIAVHPSAALFATGDIKGVITQW